MIETLRLNREGLVNLRRILYAMGEHPPAEIDENRKRLREVERSLGLSLHTKVDTVKHKRSSNGVTERR